VSEVVPPSKTLRGPAGEESPRLPRWSLWAAIIGGWTLLSLLLAPEVYLHFLGAGRPIPWGQVVALTVTNTAIAVAFAPAIVWLTRRFNFDRGRWPASLAIHTAACLAFSVSHSGLYWLLCFASHGELGMLLFQRVHPNLITYWAIVGFTEALRHFEKSRQRERQLAETRLELLRSQLQPHFLFNTLNTIAAMMHEDVGAADRMINRLSELLRLALEGASSHEATLDQEINFIQAYLEIHRARFGEGLELVLDVEPRVRSALVPGLILQPLVENALRHGFASRPTRGTIRIEARAHGDVLVLRVVDDGRGLQDPAVAEARRGLGLANTRERLEHIYPGRHRLSLERNPAGGAMATLTIPVRYAAEEPVPTAEKTEARGSLG
jgi:two-component system LytT family sensor kinase